MWQLLDDKIRKNLKTYLGLFCFTMWRNCDKILIEILEAKD